MPAAARRFALLALLLAAASPAGAAADAWVVDPAVSRFAVLTHRAGLAGRLGHDHLVVARAPEVEIDFDPADPGAAAVRFRVPVLALEADPAADRAALAPRLVELGALAGDLPPIAEDDRAEIRRAMLGARQIFAERFPEIRAELSGLSPGADGAWTARLAVTLRAERVEREIALAWSADGERLEGELLAELAFTDFRIDPYSALLGAIRNADRFHVYAKLVARRVASAGD